MSTPERIQFLSAVLLTSRDAARLAEFYRDVLGLPLAEERHGNVPQHWGCELGDVHFAIPRASAGCHFRCGACRSSPRIAARTT